MKVSIVIPCWNAGQTIGEAIESALCQSYFDTEVIVIDDGSTDSSLEIIRSFGDRVRWKSVPNGGGAAARNHGVRIAKGNLIQFLDADDMLLPNKLQRQVPHALSVGAEFMSVCFGTTCGNNAYFDWQYARVYGSDRDPVDFVLGGVLPTPAPLHFRKNLLKVGGFDESLPCAQEFDLHLRLVSRGLQIAQLPETLFVVRHRPCSVSSDSLKVTRQKHYIYGKAMAMLRSRNALTGARARSLGIAHARTATGLEIGGCLDEAAACRRDALRLCPDAEALAWTPRWRPLVRTFGSVRTSRLRRWIKSFRSEAL